MKETEITEESALDLEDAFIRFTIKESLSEYVETSKNASDFIYDIEGTILTETETETELGFIKCSYIAGDKIIKNGLFLMDAFDSVNDSLCEIGEHLFNTTTNELNEDVFDECWLSNDFLYIDELFIAPEYRRKNLGLAAIKAAIRRFAERCTAVILHATPLRIEPLQIPQEEAETKLRKYYAMLGFEQIEKTNYLLKNLCYV